MAQDPLEQTKRKRKLRSQILTAVFASVLVYMAVGTVEALWQNYAINKEINKLRAEIVRLQEEGRQLKYLIAYLGTESFKEREARRKLGYKKPGEQVLALPNSILEELSPGQANGSDDLELKPELSNPQKWSEFIFG
ncbi:septum formation initiator family protein [Patescibacteria group bacterium]|nr:septum formation initiator family protein [Patescibacteria group bacterium]